MSPAQTRTLWGNFLKCWRSLVPLRSKPPCFSLSEDADALYPTASFPTSCLPGEHAHSDLWHPCQPAQPLWPCLYFLTATASLEASANLWICARNKQINKQRNKASQNNKPKIMTACQAQVEASAWDQGCWGRKQESPHRYQGR